MYWRVPIIGILNPYIIYNKPKFYDEKKILFYLNNSTHTEVHIKIYILINWIKILTHLFYI